MDNVALLTDAYTNALYRTLVQSLNSPFFPPPIGAEPGRAKGESRITCMRMLRGPPFSPPNRGKNHIWKYFPDSALLFTANENVFSLLYRQLKTDGKSSFLPFAVCRKVMLNLANNNINIQATISVFRLVKNMSINAKSVEFSPVPR